MQKFLLTKLKTIPPNYWLLLVIVVGGIFLRIFHFADWLQFSPDEARDATVVGDALTGKTPLPLLGPIAGGTYFHLGPIFYYFQYICAWLFGNDPDKMAYFDLLTSILTIPLAFLFLKRYFRESVSLILTGILSSAYFFVYISRFASNPNSIPFFTLLFLFGILELLEGKKHAKMRWAILLGVALGVGVQLHTLLLLIMPTVVMLVFAYLLFRQELVWKNILLTLGFCLLLNLPQILSELQTGGQNLQTFFESSTVQTKGGSKFLQNTGEVLACQIQANAQMISSVMNVKGCGDIFSAEKTVKKYRGTPGVVSGVRLFKLLAFLSGLFSLLGYFLFLRAWRQESDLIKRNFLTILFLYNLIALLFFLPVAGHMEIRYFVILFFIPLVFLGFLLEFLLEKFSKYGKPLCLLLGLILVGVNLTVVAKASVAYQQKQASDSENSILGEIKPIVAYLQSQTTSETIYLTGERTYLRRFFPALSYLGRQNGLKVLELESAAEGQTDLRVFAITSASTENSLKKKTKTDTLADREIGTQKQFGKILISALK